MREYKFEKGESITGTSHSVVLNTTFAAHAAAAVAAAFLDVVVIVVAVARDFVAGEFLPLSSLSRDKEGTQSRRQGHRWTAG